MRAKLRKRLRAEFSHSRLIQDRARLPRATGPGKQDGFEFLNDVGPVAVHACAAGARRSPASPVDAPPDCSGHR